MKSEYDKQAEKFLKDTKTTLTIERANPQTEPIWKGPHGYQYKVTLQNDRGKYTFDFWDSLAAKEEGRAKPSAYSVLACLDQLYADDFEDFCNEFGYDSDSRTAEKTYNAMLEQDRHLRKLFTLDELEKLAEVN
jgi:hypothetical protein